MTNRRCDVRALLEDSKDHNPGGARKGESGGEWPAVEETAGQKAGFGGSQNSVMVWLHRARCHSVDQHTGRALKEGIIAKSQTEEATMLPRKDQPQVLAGGSQEAVASRMGQTEVVRLLLQHGEDGVWG